MKIAYFDSLGGASGDMLLGALASAGAPVDAIQGAVAALRLPGCEVRFERVMKGALSAVQAQVITPKKEQHRHYTDLAAILEAGALSSSIKTRALSILGRIASVEAGIHGLPLEEVHLHELGGDDTLADIAGVLAGLEALQVERAFCSPLPLGRGWIRSAHGALPLPAPATLALLEGASVRPVDLEVELVTPTGAALLTGICESFGNFPSMRLLKVGSGAGRRDLPFPNVIRLWLGEVEAPPDRWIVEELSSLETNIDDMNPQFYGYIMDRLFAAGALDVTLTPMQMKKNRPAVLLAVLCRPVEAEALTSILFEETTTLGVRRSAVQRVCLPRTQQTVATEFGPIRVKVANLDGVERAAPEYEDCRRAAETYRVSLAAVIEAAQAAYKNKNLVENNPAGS
jgi:uncharacterized protein (TIGR00299 family) protein